MIIKTRMRYYTDTYLYGILNLYSKLPFYAQNVSNYLNVIPECGQIRCIVLFDRPYISKIHPEYASSLSYKEQTTQIPPSVSDLALQMAKVGKFTVQEITIWLRDNWKYVRNGVIFLNIGFAYAITNPLGQKERIFFCLYLREILRLQVSEYKSSINIVTLGDPCYSTTQTLFNSLGIERSFIKLHKLGNPASIQHMSDSKSRQYTLEFNSTLEYLNTVYEYCKYNSVYYPYTMSKLDVDALKASTVEVIDIVRIVTQAFEEHKVLIGNDYNVLNDRLTSSLNALVGNIERINVGLAMVNTTELRPAGVASVSRRTNINMMHGTGTINTKVHYAPSETKSVPAVFNSDSDDEDEKPVKSTSSYNPESSRRSVMSRSKYDTESEPDEDNNTVLPAVYKEYTNLLIAVLSTKGSIYDKFLSQAKLAVEGGNVDNKIVLAITDIHTAYPQVSALTAAVLSPTLPKIFERLR
jgi:hypothetical protein